MSDNESVKKELSLPEFITSILIVILCIYMFAKYNNIVLASNISENKEQIERLKDRNILIEQELIKLKIHQESIKLGENSVEK